MVGLVVRHNKAIRGEGGAIALLPSTLPDHVSQQKVVEPEYDNPLILLLKDVTFDSNIAARAGGAVSVLPNQKIWARNSMCARKIMRCNKYYLKRMKFSREEILRKPNFVIHSFKIKNYAEFNSANELNYFLSRTNRFVRTFQPHIRIQTLATG